MAAIRNYKDLKAWQQAHNLVMAVYRKTRDFPSDEKYGLVSQMRRSAVSVAANIAEGFGRKTAKDKRNFYHMALGSLNELSYYLFLSRELDYLSDPQNNMDARCTEIQKMLNGLSQTAKTKPT